MNELNLPAGRDLLDPGRYFGTALAYRAAGEVTLAEGRYQGGATIPAHAHRSPYLCLVLEGSFEETWGSRREACGPGTLVFHQANEVHADRFGARGGRCFNLELGPGLAARLADERALPRERLTAGPGRAGTMAVGLRTCAEGSALEIEEAALAVLAEMSPARPAAVPRRRRPAWLDRSLERLRGEEIPSITALADEAGVHPVYFTRAFRAAMHAPPSAIARRARLERAGAALLASDAPVTAVAHDAGFADHSHFCRQFRRAFGVTPTRYRRLFA